MTGFAAPRLVLGTASLRHAAAHPDEHAASFPYRDPHGIRVIAERLDAGFIDVPSTAFK